MTLLEKGKKKILHIEFKTILLQNDMKYNYQNKFKYI